MLKYLVATALIGVSMRVAMIGVVVASEDTVESAQTPKLRVIAHVTAAVDVRYNSYREGYKIAQKEFTAAFTLVKRAIEGDTNIDVSGRVSVTEVQGFTPERVAYYKERIYYDSSAPLCKRAVNLAYRAADAASCAEDYLSAAQLYNEGGDLCDGDSPAPTLYKRSADCYAYLEDYQSALYQIDKAWKAVIMFYPLSDKHRCSLSQIVKFCKEQAAKLSSDEEDMAKAFMRRTEKFGMVPLMLILKK